MLILSQAAWKMGTNTYKCWFSTSSREANKISKNYLTKSIKLWFFSICTTKGGKKLGVRAREGGKKLFDITKTYCHPIFSHRIRFMKTTIKNVAVNVCFSQKLNIFAFWICRILWTPILFQKYSHTQSNPSQATNFVNRKLFVASFFTSGIIKSSNRTKNAIYRGDFPTFAFWSQQTRFKISFEIQLFHLWEFWMPCCEAGGVFNTFKNIKGMINLYVFPHRSILVCLYYIRQLGKWGQTHISADSLLHPEELTKFQKITWQKS